MKRSASPSDANGADASGTKKKRRSQPMGNLTNLQKRQLCVKFSQVKMTQQELCQWAKREFGLAHLPHQSTISKILARTDELTQMAPRELLSRRKGLVTHPELDTALCNWVLCARANGMKISGDIIKTQARVLAAQLGVASGMSFSNGWLGGFKKRHNIRLGSAAAALEAPGVSMVNSIASLPQLQEIARMYEPRDVFCMQETGLFYQLSPEKPAGRGRPRREQQGDRLTVVLAVNADASERPEPMFIGSIKLPPLTEELDADTRNFYYQNNKRAWMTPVMFQDWVSAFDTKMRDENRIVLLLVSAAPSHIALGLELTNVRLEILPPSMDPMPVAVSAAMDASDLASASASIAETALGETSVADPTQAMAQTEMAQADVAAQQQAATAMQIPVSVNMPTTMQPMDAGIILAFKRRFRRYHMLYALDRHEAGRHDVFHVDQLQAMRWARHCWKQELSEDVIRKCWAVTEIVTPKPTPETYAAFETIEDDIDKEICDTVQSLGILRPLLIDDFVSPRDENVEIHCSGTDETDFMYTVPEISPSDSKDKKFAVDSGDASQPQVITTSSDLTPRLQELHARIEASAATAVSMGLTTSAVTIGDSNGAIPTSAADVLGMAGLGGGNMTDAPATNEQLIECFKVLLPELDRLRFDDHTKKSIRTTFRRLKETTEQQLLDRKRGTLKKPLPPPQYPPHMQPATHPQEQEQQFKQLQLEQTQQLQQQLLEQQEQLAQQQAMSMAAQATHMEENSTSTVL